MRWPLTLAVVVIFAVGMANVEAAAVIYIRELHGGIDPLSVTLDSVVNEYDDGDASGSWMACRQ